MIQFPYPRLIDILVQQFSISFVCVYIVRPFLCRLQIARPIFYLCIDCRTLLLFIYILSDPSFVHRFLDPFLYLCIECYRLSDPFFYPCINCRDLFLCPCLDCWTLSFIYVWIVGPLHCITVLSMLIHHTASSCLAYRFMWLFMNAQLVSDHPINVVLVFLNCDTFIHRYVMTHLRV